jgi:hypothetical protein
MSKWIASTLATDRGDNDGGPHDCCGPLFTSAHQNLARCVGLRLGRFSSIAACLRTERRQIEHELNEHELHGPSQRLRRF